MIIHAHYDPKPIPDRRFDWTAVDDNYEPGQPMGHGITKADAIFDLLEQMADRLSHVAS